MTLSPEPEPPASRVSPAKATPTTPTTPAAPPSPPSTVPAGVDADGVIHYPGDEGASRAPGSALVLLVVSLVGGALYVWLYGQLLAGFDWLAALSLRSSALVVVGGVVLMLGAVLLIRHGLIWASRLGAVLVLAAPLRLCVDRIVATGGAETGSALLSLLNQTWPALVVLAISFGPGLGRWRRRRQQVMKAKAAGRRT